MREGAVEVPAPEKVAAIAGVSGLLGVAVLLGLVATQTRAVPRCGGGFVEMGPRCCAPGQRVVAGSCVGVASSGRHDSYLGTRGAVTIEGGTSSWAPPDTTLGTNGERVAVGSFRLATLETSWGRYRACVAAGVCAEVAPISGGDVSQAAHGLTRDEARTYCRWNGGRLPTDAEWLRAAIGDVELRYPWGDPDALCTRAAYGLVDGPCAYGATGPDTVGAHPFGATPQGVLDLAGNVAEWVEEGPSPNEGVVRGGSFIDDEATSLRARWRRVVPADARLPWIGVRCAYGEARRDD